MMNINLTIKQFLSLMNTTFGGRLRQERKRLELTQEQFASLGGVKRVSQHLYEQDGRVPDIHYLQRLSEHHVDVVYVLLGHRAKPFASDKLTLSGGLLCDVYSAVDEFGRDVAGDPLPLSDRLKLFQFLCAAVAGSSAETNVQNLHDRLVTLTRR